MTLFQFWQVPQLVPVSPRGGGKAIPLSKMKKSTSDKNSDDYRQRRERNNLAVKKSRMRSKQKAQDTQQRVNELKEENERLEAKIKLLSKELSVLKDLFLEHAHNLADNVQPPTSSGGPGDLCNNNTTAASEGLMLLCSMLCCGLCGGSLGKSFYLIVLCSFFPSCSWNVYCPQCLTCASSVCTLKFGFLFHLYYISCRMLGSP